MGIHGVLWKPMELDGNGEIAGGLDREPAPYLTAGVSSTSWETEPLAARPPGQGVGTSRAPGGIIEDR